MPVVRRTGGLADTVKDVDAADAGATPNGFTFDGVDEASEDGALDRALTYFHRKAWWDEVRDMLLYPGKTDKPCTVLQRPLQPTSTLRQMLQARNATAPLSKVTSQAMQTFSSSSPPTGGT